MFSKPQPTFIEEEKTGDCDLECKRKGFRLQKLKQLATIKLPKFQVEGGKEGHEFIGPVRVVLVTTPKREYRRKTWGAAFIVVAFFAIGATSMPVFFYSLAFKLDTMASLHIILFTVGFQVLAPAAFLTMNTYNGSSNIIKPRHRKLDYLVLKVASLVCIISGIVACLSSTTMNFTDHVWSFKNLTAHGGLGLTAIILCIVDICTFPCLPCNTKRIWPRCALVLCIPSFFFSSLCFIFGLLRENFENWLPLPSILYFLIVFCIYYTFVSIWNPLSNLKCAAGK